MKRILVVFILFYFILSINCQERLSSWGIWNDKPLGDRARIVETRYGSFYQNMFDGVWIVENLQELFPGKEAIPAIVNLGQYDEIISYTEIQDGIIFIIRAKRTKNDPERGGALFKYFNVELKMEFLSKNTCRFTYLNHDEIDGYLFGSFGNITREDLIYERIPVEDNPKEDVNGLSGKELDPETGLYYYGARYLDPKYSIWISADPALGEYIPGAPVNDEAKKRNGNLPGMGGVFNTVNLHLYHYAGNNPVRYTDPDGEWILNTNCFYPEKYYQNDTRWSSEKLCNDNKKKSLGQVGCAVAVIANGLNAFANYNSLLSGGPLKEGLNPSFANKNMTSKTGADFTKLAKYISDNYKLKTTLTDTKDANKVIAASKTDKLTLIFAHMSTDSTEGEHWININHVNFDGTFNGSDVYSNKEGGASSDYTKSDKSKFDRYIIIEVNLN